MAVLKMDSVTENNERRILREFFDTVSALGLNDGSVSDLKIIKATQEKLKVALRGSEFRCTCPKMTWGMICETCQGSDNELVHLRIYFHQMKNAKRFNMTGEDIQIITENTRKAIAA